VTTSKEYAAAVIEDLRNKGYTDDEISAAVMNLLLEMQLKPK
jgi:hypothetical protein